MALRFSSASYSAWLARILGEIDKHIRAAVPDNPYPDLNIPRGGTLHGLRDELFAHLERIQPEEGCSSIGG